jgi:hypothetical protein
MASRLLLRGSGVFRRSEMFTAFLPCCSHASRCVQRSIWWKRVDVFIYNIHIRFTLHLTPTSQAEKRDFNWNIQFTCNITLVPVADRLTFIVNQGLISSHWDIRTTLDYLSLVNTARLKWKCVRCSKQEQKFNRPIGIDTHTHKHKPDETSSKPAWGQQRPWV